MRRRAFTLIEIMTVILVLAMVAAIATPSLTAAIRSQREKSYFERLESLVLGAQRAAVANRATVVLRSENGELITERVATETTDGVEVGRLTGLDGANLSKFTLRGSEVGEGDWEVRFYADGTADAAALEVQSSGSARHLVIDPKTGRPRTVSGELPVDTAEKWPVGEYVPR